MPSQNVMRSWFAGLTLAFNTLTGSACLRDARDIHAARSTPSADPSGLIAHSWPVCSLVGPRNALPGIYGTDLGFSARGRDDEQITLLFGDTWLKPVDACRYPGPESNDLQASLPRARPPQLVSGPPVSSAAASCKLLDYARKDPGDATSWQPIRVFPNSVAESADSAMDMSFLRTPAAAFSDGQRFYGIFSRQDPAYCSHSSECPADMHCSTDREDRAAVPLGECSGWLQLAPDAPKDLCRDDRDCGPAAGSCKPATRGVCMASRPFHLRTRSGNVVPTWYHDDARRGIARILYIAAAIWPDRPSDYATLARFATNRFQNVAVRGVTYFDADHPERNDYRPGYHTLLVWGRASFVEYGGAQALPFFAYVPLAELAGEPESVRWNPRFFAGYGPAGEPRWSLRESEAQPIYGTQASVVEASGEKIAWREPEFDYVEWAALTYVVPLQRWVMLYGGDLPAFMVIDPATGRARDPVHLQFAPGAIHMRSAPHPWGRMRASDERGWSSPEPLLTRQAAAQYLACGDGGPRSLAGCLEEADPHTPFDLIAALSGMAAKSTPAKAADVAASCIAGEFAIGAQNALSGDRVGRLYAPNVLDDWTEDVTPRAAPKGTPRAAEIYWNVSTWNPYQVVLIKSRIEER